MVVQCRRCGVEVKSFSPMRKWCVDCRRLVGLAQAKARKVQISDADCSNWVHTTPLATTE
ncbi:MAG: hypothetical protein HY363_00160 [Candidatus Aenigmarchaeota archaeon]|nr:hypothetical protein [Candidatus Aenigmarchaeota archaeon]